LVIDGHCIGQDHNGVLEKLLYIIGQLVVADRCPSEERVGRKAAILPWKILCVKSSEVVGGCQSREPIE
jgi:hypothetical protein